MRLLGMKASGMYRKGCKWTRKLAPRTPGVPAIPKTPAQRRYCRWTSRHYNSKCYVIFMRKRILIRDNQFNVQYTVPRTPR